MSIGARLKQYAFGYALLYGLLLVAFLPCCLPFVATLAVGAGLVGAGGEPFPRALLLPFLLASESLSLVVGLAWFGGAWAMLSARLGRLRGRLLRRNQSRLLLVCAMMLSFPLLAAIISPLALSLSLLSAVLGPESSPFFASKVTRIALFAVAFLLLGIVLGKPLSQRRADTRSGRMVMRAREVFLDWTMSAVQPDAVAAERQRLLK